MIAPTMTFGEVTSVDKLAAVMPVTPAAEVPAFASASLIAEVNEPNSAVAARTAVAIAMPLVIAFVVLPTASS